ncbi:hypothetical protein Q8A73_009175 [Channa argus]|nr:hypothetical protein Q8A73_009175 [Channa argus]
MRKSRSVLTVSPNNDSKDPPDCCLSESFTSPSCTLGVDLRRGLRRFSGNLQLPPLSWRQGERSRTPDEEIMARPTSLPFGAPPRIDITPVDSEWLGKLRIGLIGKHLGIVPLSSLFFSTQHSPPPPANPPQGRRGLHSLRACSELLVYILNETANEAFACVLCCAVLSSQL